MLRATLTRFALCCGLAAVVLIAVPRGAEACGVWRLNDHEAGRVVKYYIHTMHVWRDGPRKGRTINLHIDGRDTPSMFLRVGKRKELDLRGGKLRRSGRTVGTVAGDVLRIGRNEYTIKIEHRPAKTGPSVMRWWVEVRRGEQLVADGQAMSLCLDGPPPELYTKAGAGRETDEIRRRVIYYLAWRDLIARLRPLAKPTTPATKAAPRKPGKKGLHELEP